MFTHAMSELQNIQNNVDILFKLFKKYFFSFRGFCE